MSKPSIREKILQNIEATLPKIDLVDGYGNTVLLNNVRRVLKAPTDIKEFPTIFIVSGPDNATESPYTRSDFTWRITLVGCIDERNPNNLPRAVEDMISDIRR